MTGDHGRGLPALLHSRGYFYGWVIVAIAMMTQYMSGPGQSYMFSVFIDPIMADTGLSRTGISSLYAAGTFVSAGMVFFISRLADRRGPRFTLTIIGIGFGFACFGMAFAGGWLLFSLALASLRGLGQGALPINGTLLIAQWFVRRRGRAMAVAGLAGALSTATLPPVGRLLIENLGWRESYLIFGLVIWLVIVPVAIFLVRNRPEDVGLHPDGSDEPPVGERVRPAGEPDRRKVLTSRMFWMLAIPMSMPGLVDTALIFHQTSIFAERGINATIAAAAFTPMALASASFGFAAGFLIDRFGPRPLYIVALLILLVPPVMLQFINTTPMAFVYGTIIGAGSGMSMMVSRVTWAHYYGRHGLGRVQGSAMMISIVGSALGPVIMAFIRSQSDDYTPALFFMIGLMFVALALMLVNRAERVEQPA
ncbi:MAG TPA: MFS transporter [Thermomicrobiales bacterium]|nr:MFS transporter [Thermomicrobiales bacterium]